MIPRDVQPASFRGVPFQALDVSKPIGRRVVVHEHPHRDEPTTEDMGRQTRRWEIMAYLLGEDVGAQANALAQACNAPGTGVLVHPTDGRVIVRCEPGTIRRDGSNTAEVSLSFVEAGSVFAPAPVPVAQASRFRELLNAAAAAFYRATYLIEVTSRRVEAALSGSLADRAAALLLLTGQVTGADVADYVEAVRVIEDAATDSTRTTDTVTDAIVAIVETVEDTDGAQVLADSLGAQAQASYALADAGASTSSDAAILDMTAALDLALYLAALGRAAQLGTEATWASYEDATGYGETIGDALADVATLGADAATYAAALDLRAALDSAIREVAPTLPRAREIFVPAPTPALVLAWDLYEDTARALELTDRNDRNDPGFVSGDLQVLSA